MKRELSRENRRLPRIAANMPVRAQIQSGWLQRGRRVDARVLDYNRFGAALVSARRVRSGSRLLMDLRAEHFVLRRLRAEVVDCRREGQMFRIGVRFQCPLGRPVCSSDSSSLTALLGLEESLVPA